MKLEELQQLVIVEQEQRLKMPTIFELEHSNIPIIAEKNLSGGSLQVYANGFVAFKCEGHRTVFKLTDKPVEYLGRVETVRLKREEFLERNWLFYTLLSAEERMSAQLDKWYYKHTISYSGFSEEWAPLGDTNNPETQLLKSQERDELVELVGERNLQILKYYYLEGWNQRQIAELFDISNQAVSRRIKLSMHKIRSYYQIDKDVVRLRNDNSSKK